MESYIPFFLFSPLFCPQDIGPTTTWITGRTIRGQARASTMRPMRRLTTSMTPAARTCTSSNVVYYCQIVLSGGKCCTYRSVCVSTICSCLGVCVLFFLVSSTRQTAPNTGGGGGGGPHKLSSHHPISPICDFLSDIPLDLFMAW